MNALQESFNNFQLIGVPCNHFGLQEPGGNGSEIMNGITYVRPGGGFQPNFPLTEKLDVNGENEHPLYTYLKSACPPAWSYFKDISRYSYSPIKSSDVRWNFEKFLIDTNGVPLMRYSETVHPLSIKDDVKNLLMQER